MSTFSKSASVAFMVSVAVCALTLWAQPACAFWDDGTVNAVFVTSYDPTPYNSDEDLGSVITGVYPLEREAPTDGCAKGFMVGASAGTHTQAPPAWDGRGGSTVDPNGEYIVTFRLLTGDPPATLSVGFRHGGGSRAEATMYEIQPDVSAGSCTGSGGPPSVTAEATINDQLAHGGQDRTTVESAALLGYNWQTGTATLALPFTQMHGSVSAGFYDCGGWVWAHGEDWIEVWRQ